MSTVGCDADRILIVGGDPTLRLNMTGRFEAQGDRVEVVDSVAEAMGALEPIPALILLDMRLPDGDALDILRRVRRSRLATCVAIISRDLKPTHEARLRRLHPDLTMLDPSDFGDDPSPGPGATSRALAAT